MNESWMSLLSSVPILILFLILLVAVIFIICKIVEVVQGPREVTREKMVMDYKKEIEQAYRSPT